MINYEKFAGIDEAGRGPLAGPVVASCVILPKNWKYKKLLNDSKKMSEKQRKEAFYFITRDCLYGVGIINNNHIDTLGIRLSTHLAMIRAVQNLGMIPDKLKIDGKDNFHFPIPYKYIIKGDTKHHCIMAASIIAKVYRDCLMKNYAILFPEYDFDKHKGYGTKSHIEKIKKYNFCEIHRSSYTIN